jgi:hypothetical protein
MGIGWVWICEIGGKVEMWPEKSGGAEWFERRTITERTVGNLGSLKKRGFFRALGRAEEWG